MDFLSMQFMARFAHLLVWHAKVVSGAYKQRRVFHGTGGPELTDEEKLSDAISIMLRHTSILGEIAEHRADKETE